MNGKKCQICANGGSSHSGLHCPSCVRALLYSTRIQRASILLEKEGLATQIEHVLSLDSSSEYSQAASQAGRHVGRTSFHADKTELEDSQRKVETMARQAATWRAEVQICRRRLDAQKYLLKKRRGEIDTARLRLNDTRKASTAASLTHYDPTATPTINQHESLVAWRVRHLRDLAFWSRLQRVRRPWSGQGQDSRSFEYHIFGLPIPDLRKLNHFKDGDQLRLTAVLTHVCRLLHLTSRYLQVRLPAELIVPHRSWPLPMILSPATSYTGEPLSFPYKQLTSPSSSRLSRNESVDEQRRSARRPRPLFLVRQLDQMASEDAPGYSRFVEAVALLAWNIAWLCRTQGVPVGDTNWEDACDMGRNLWQLLIDGTRGTVDPQRALESSQNGGIPDKMQQAVDHSSMQSSRKENSIGAYSHGSAFNYLRAGSHSIAQAGTKDVSARGWILASPVKLVSELRGSLLGELAVMEAVLVGEDGEELGTAENGMQLHDEATLNASKDLTPLRHAGVGKMKGTSGWTKLRTRRDSNSGL